MRKIILFGFLAIINIAQAQTDPKKYGMEEDNLPMGLKIGDKIENFTSTNQNGEPFDLYIALENGPVVLNFYRGNWCPYCSKYLNSLNDSLSMIIDEGAIFVGISPENKEHLDESAGMFPGLTIISDEGDKIGEQFDGVFIVNKAYRNKIKLAKQIDLAEYNDQEEAMLVVPATYVISKEGIIVFRHFDYNYKERASINSIIEALKDLNAQVD